MAQEPLVSWEKVNIFQANNADFQYVVIFLSILHFHALLNMECAVLEFIFSSAGSAFNIIISIIIKEEISNQSEF